MASTFTLQRLSESIERAERHWHERHKPGDTATASGLTIALTREAGAQGTSVAREIGRRLDWPVYDNELVERIARDLGLRSSLLDSVDERRQSWLLECLQSFGSSHAVSESAYVRRLVETVLSLGTHGNCVIVGRGAAFILPQERTLRVRMISPLEDRVAAIARDRSWSPYQARTWVATTDRERRQFIRSHFSRDPEDPINFDLLINSARWTVPQAADLVLEALHVREREVLRPQPTPAA